MKAEFSIPSKTIGAELTQEQVDELGLLIHNYIEENVEYPGNFIVYGTRDTAKDPGVRYH